MASLYRLDVIVRGNSTISQDDAIRWTKNWVNQRQEDDENKEFYADLFDSRTNKAWKVFSDVAVKNRAISNNYICKNGEVIKGVIYTTPFAEMIEELKIEIAFLKEEVKNNDEDIEHLKEDDEIKLLV